MIVYHVAIETAGGYLTRCASARQASLEYLMGLRGRGVLIAAGPAPDGARCDLFCRAQQPEDVVELVESSPCFVHGLWIRYTPRSFAQFLEPWKMSPPVPDESRIATIVEGATPDVEMASFALIEARGAGRLALGGFFAGGNSIALMGTGDPADAMAELEATGLWTAGSLRARPIAYVI